MVMAIKINPQNSASLFTVPDLYGAKCIWHSSINQSGSMRWSMSIANDYLNNELKLEHEKSHDCAVLWAVRGVRVPAQESIP